MIKTATTWPLLQLLVKLYNQTIQSYHHFPDIIIFGHHRLEKDEFDDLLQEGLIEPFFADSFGRFYRLSGKAHQLLLHSLHKRKGKPMHGLRTERQASLPFY